MYINNLLQMQSMLLGIMLVGAYLGKKGVIKGEGKKLLADLVVSVTLPCSIFKSFQLEMDSEILKSCLVIFLIGVVIQTGSCIFNQIFYRRFSHEKKSVLQYSTICSNAATLGNPVVEGLFGSMGILYASVFLIPQRALMWSLALTYFSQKESWKKVAKKLLMNPCVIAVELGLIVMITQIQIPGFINQPIKTLSQANTGIAMLLVGSILVEIPFKQLLEKGAVYYTAIRLFILPLVAFTICTLFSANDLVKGVVVVLSAMPAASVVPAVAAKYQADELFATKCLVLSTLCSVISLPLWCLVL